MSTDIDEKDYWDAVFSSEDPWNYTSEYEKQKYQHTLDTIPDISPSRVLELGCAEGHFTKMLSAIADNVTAVDISERALNRARERCAGLGNVKFEQHDISEGVYPGEFDLVVCSEILYYLRDRYAVEAFASAVKSALPLGGFLLMTHANMVSDDRTETGFDFNEIGAKFIGEIFSSEPGLEFIRELRTELYRVQLFRRTQLPTKNSTLLSERVSCAPREVIQRPVHFEHDAIKRGGCVVTAAEARHCWVSTEIPVLMYHRVANDGPDSLAPYRITPKLFEQQLAYLQRYGYNGLTVGEYFDAWMNSTRQSVPGKPIVLTFDDAYLDFYENAWPLLRKYGFKATVFVPVDYVGGHADWDREFGEPAKIMNWDQIIELHTQGVKFGSHSCCHKRLLELSEEQVFEDTKKSKEILEQKLGIEIVDYCYPFAAASEQIQQVVASVGYKSAVGGTGGDPADRQNPFYIPRIEIFGDDKMDDFIEKLPAPKPAPVLQRVNYRRLRSLRDRATYMGR
ncbi:MAG: polysaccharide deacetylase family protein [Xanthomonadales bacterium]|nr:polysaccharide deacetylase family protein [Xanthomonadales bacterium]